MRRRRNIDNPTAFVNQMAETKATSKIALPHTIGWKGERITLRSPGRGRQRIIYDYTPTHGSRVQRAVPKAYAESPELATAWAEDFLAARVLLREQQAAAPERAHTELGQIWAEYKANRLASHSRRQFRKDLETSMALFLEVAGQDLDARDLDQTHLDRFTAARKAGMFLRLAGGGRRLYRPVGDSAVRYNLDLVRQVLKWATRRKIHGKWLLDGNPFDRLERPKRRAGQVTIFRQVWYEKMLEVADEVDPAGRFRMMLVLARFCGQRQDAIGRLSRSDFCSTPEEIERALDRAQCRYVDASEATTIWVHGAIHWRKENQKGAENYRSDPAQYDRVLPAGPVVRAELDRYLALHWNPRGLGLSAPLFPTDTDDAKPLYRDLPQKWFVAAEELLEDRGVELGLRSRTRWHGWRRQRRTELKQAGVHDKDAALLGGWSVAAQKGVVNGQYLGFSATDIFRAACVGQ